MRKDMLTIDMRLKMLISKMIMIKATIIWRVSRNATKQNNNDNVNIVYYLI